MGRPTKLDDLVAQRIVAAIEKGNTRQCAAAAAGIHKATFLEWLARGRAGEQPYADFADRVKKADAVAEMDRVEIIRDAASSGTWQAAAWWLERRRSKHFALRRPTEKVEPTLTEEQAREEYKRLTGREYGT